MTSPQPDVQPPPYPRRFSWPMRLFLTLFLAAITYRCFGILLPLSDWKAEFEMQHSYPTRLSSLPELAKKGARCRPQRSESHCRRFHDYRRLDLGLLEALAEQGDATQDQIRDRRAKVTACWFDGRLAFLEHLAGIDEGWPMFSPELANVNYATRARLLYADDTVQVVRQSVEPEDYRHYTHWMQGRIKKYESDTDESDEERCLGYCNLLRHRFAHNAAGAQLVTIVLFQVKIIYPEPGVDAMAYYQNQMALTESPPRLPHSCRSDRARPAALIVGAASGVFGGRVVRDHAVLWTPQVLPDFYEYDAVHREGRLLVDNK